MSGPRQRGGGSAAGWRQGGGVGAVATQAWANPRYGPLGLSALSGGLSPETSLERLVSADPLRERRQAAILAPSGRAAVFTGNECLDWAGGRVGPNYAVQGNILAGQMGHRGG